MPTYSIQSKLVATTTLVALDLVLQFVPRMGARYAWAQPVPVEAPTPEPPVGAPTEVEGGETSVSPLASSVPPAPSASQVVTEPLVDVAPPPPPAIPAPSVVEEKPGVDISGAPGKGLTISTGETFSLNIKSRIQVRYQVSTFEDPEKPAQQLANIGTARIWLGGNVYKPELSYQIQLAVAGRDYRDGATSPVFDAYMEWKAHRDFAVRAGQYFVPFDRLRTVREWGLQLTDRPRPVQEFTLDRDVGVTFFSESFLGDASPIAWYVSAFGGHGTNQVNPASVGTLVTGRLELRPFGPIDDDREGDLERRQQPGLALGGGVGYNTSANRLRGTTGATFVGGTTKDTYLALDATFKWLGVAVQAEYLHKDTSSTAFVSERADGTLLTEYTRQGSGWVLQASYVLPFPLEFVGRLSRLYAGGTAEAAFISEVNDRGSEIAGGANYYFNGHRMKAQAAWVARTNASLAMGEADHQAVVQLDATF